MIGLLPGKIPSSSANEESTGGGDETDEGGAPGVNIVFGSSPFVVSVPLPCQPDPNLDSSLSSILKEDPNSVNKPDKTTFPEKKFPTR